MVEVSQGVDHMTGIIGDLYVLIREGGLSHDRDLLFATHVLNAIPRMSERGYTLSKSKSRGHIDGVIALSLAVDRVRNKRRMRSPVVVL
jgi:phage terminase large subunit-like protein